MEEIGNGVLAIMRASSGQSLVGGEAYFVNAILFDKALTLGTIPIYPFVDSVIDQTTIKRTFKNVRPGFHVSGGKIVQTETELVNLINCNIFIQEVNPNNPFEVILVATKAPNIPQKFISENLPFSKKEENLVEVDF